MEKKSRLDDNCVMLTSAKSDLKRKTATLLRAEVVVLSLVHAAITPIPSFQISRFLVRKDHADFLCRMKKCELLHVRRDETRFFSKWQVLRFHMLTIKKTRPATYHTQKQPTTHTAMLLTRFARCLLFFPSG